jgi:tRNA (guanine-N7-)-methyltransferase
VTRKGRNPQAQLQAFEKYWSAYGLECPNEVNPFDFSQIFNTNVQPILEIGFGMGHSLLEQAIRSPDQPFIGIEVHLPGIGRLLNGIAEHNLNNLRIFRGNAIDILNKAIPDGGLKKLQLFFPDPWPKARHHKRRLVQTDFVNLVAKKLGHNGLLHMATDWADYADHMRSVLTDHPLYQPLIAEDLARLVLERPKTKFENRGLQLGHAISDLAYLKL